MITRHWRFCWLAVCFAALATPAVASEGLARLSMEIDEFRGLSQAEQKSVVRRAFERRLQATKNIHFEALQLIQLCEYHDGKVGKLVNRSNGTRYRYWRLGKSYRIDWDLGGREVLTPDQFNVSGFDASSGVVRSTVRHKDSQRIFARIDTRQNTGTLQIRYPYWLDGKRDRRNGANFLIRDLVDQFEQSTLDAPLGAVYVHLTVPWQPAWGSGPPGTQKLLLDPTKGFLPVEGTAYYEQVRSNGKTLWRDEKFYVEASTTVVEGVWMPTKLKELIRAGSGESDRVAIEQTDISDIKAGAVTASDLLVAFPKGTAVVDAIDRVSYVVGEKDEHLRERTLSSADQLLKEGSAAPNIEMTRLSDKKVEKMADHRGKVVVLEFWARWCGPCKGAMFALQEYPGKYPHWGDRVILVAACDANPDTSDERDAIVEHLRGQGWDRSRNVLVGAESLKTYCVRAFPTTYVIDQQGRIAAANYRLDVSGIVNALLREE